MTPSVPDSDTPSPRYKRKESVRNLVKLFSKIQEQNISSSVATIPHGGSNERPRDRWATNSSRSVGNSPLRQTVKAMAEDVAKIQIPVCKDNTEISEKPAFSRSLPSMSN